MSGGALDATTATVVRVAAAMAAGPAVLERELGSARARVEAGEVEGAAVEEVLLQGHLFLGFPATLEGLAAWREAGAPAPDGDERVVEPGARVERGRRLCRRVYGDAYGQLRANVRGLHPALDRWMVEVGYGEVLSRSGLGSEARELAVVATLAVVDRPRQLHAHLRGALNVGATPGAVDAALVLAAEVADEPMASARELWGRVRSRTEEASCS